MKTGQIDILSDVKEFVDSLPSDEKQHRCGCCDGQTDENGMCWKNPCYARDMVMGKDTHIGIHLTDDMKRFWTHCCNSTCHLR